MRQHWALAIAGSTLFHGLLVVAMPLSPKPPAVRDWHESVMIEIPDRPAPEIIEVQPPPDPEPEPEPAPVEPEVIDAEELPDVDVADIPAPPDTTPADAPPVQGLTADSFSAGAKTRLTVRAGTTLRAAASTTSLKTPVSRPKSVGWSEVPKRPRCQPPAVKVPDSVIDERLEGEVHIRMDIGADGAVHRVHVIRGLSADADAACVAAWSSVTCKPARKGKVAVAVSNMPHSCIYKAVR